MPNLVIIAISREFLYRYRTLMMVKKKERGHVRQARISVKSRTKISAMFADMLKTVYRSTVLALCNGFLEGNHPLEFHVLYAEPRTEFYNRTSPATRCQLIDLCRKLDHSGCASSRVTEGTPVFHSTFVNFGGEIA